MRGRRLCESSHKYNKIDIKENPMIPWPSSVSCLLSHLSGWWSTTLLTCLMGGAPPDTACPTAGWCGPVSPSGYGRRSCWTVGSPPLPQHSCCSGCSDDSWSQNSNPTTLYWLLYKWSFTWSHNSNPTTWQLKSYNNATQILQHGIGYKWLFTWSQNSNSTTWYQL